MKSHVLLEFDGESALSTDFRCGRASGLAQQLVHQSRPATSFPIRITDDAELSPDVSNGTMHDFDALGALGMR
ncbi:hypothetical protein [Mesorhizobium shangrilense]|uniref:Uncharacterized protein n=1 Tax=Mesorhizobium shangrilense TaxID=460060 RepID=A0ABV2DN52_9HYPH